MIHKELLIPARVRRPPREGWSWIDRRFLREHAARLSHEAITLYRFLAAVSDHCTLGEFRLRWVEIALGKKAALGNGW
jgi:hypothetical protein